MYIWASKFHQGACSGLGTLPPQCGLGPKPAARKSCSPGIQGHAATPPPRQTCSDPDQSTVLKKWKWAAEQVENKLSLQDNSGKPLHGVLQPSPLCCCCTMYRSLYMHAGISSSRSSSRRRPSSRSSRNRNSRRRRRSSHSSSSTDTFTLSASCTSLVAVAVAVAVL